MSTPYDNKIGLVLWTGESVGERSMAELARTVVQWAPNVKAIYVKTSDGDTWQGKFDDKQTMAVNGPADIERWVRVLNDHDLEFHAWCVLRGMDIRGEVERVTECCNVAGVRSMLLDVEDGPGYFAGGAADARNLIQSIRAGIPDDFHLALNFDARGQHPKHIHIQEWLPHVGSLHPMVYHKDFGRSVESALRDTFRTTSNFNLPVFPMLQAYNNVSPADIRRAGQRSLALGARGVSYFRLGTIGPEDFQAIQEVELADTPSDEPSEPPPPPPTEVEVVRPGQEGYSDGIYGNRPPHQVWQTFNDTHGWLVKYKRSANPQEVYAQYEPDLPAKGRYLVETFIPNTNADTRSALYFIVHHQNGQRVERKVSLDQSIHFNDWAPLGIFDLDPALDDDGRVSLVDYSIEQPPRRVAFTAIRWQPLSDDTGSDITGTADGFDSPVGSELERRGTKVWPGHWKDANGFMARYLDSAGRVAYHTGADLNLNFPSWNADRGMPVYAAASGTVTWTGWRGKYWRNIIIVQHDPLPDGTEIFTRYAHVESMIVKEGDRVKRGQQICRVGTSGGPNANYHLHFDISPTQVLKQNPGHWPGTNQAGVEKHYIDPAPFIATHRP